MDAWALGGRQALDCRLGTKRATRLRSFMTQALELLDRVCSHASAGR